MLLENAVISVADLWNTLFDYPAKEHGLHSRSIDRKIAEDIRKELSASC